MRNVMALLQARHLYGWPQTRPLVPSFRLPTPFHGPMLRRIFNNTSVSSG